MHALLMAAVLFSCEGASEVTTRHAVIERKPAAAFVRVTSKEATALEKKGTRTFDLGSYDGVGRVLAHAGKTLTNNRHARELTLVLRAGANVWHLRARDDVAWDETLWIGEEDAGARGAARDMPDPVVIRATPDRSLPLFAVKFGQTWAGMHADRTTATTLLIDLRKTPPSILQLRCEESLSGGRCGSDQYAATNRQMTCAWQSAQRDFRCDSVESLDVGWARRTAGRSFWLLANRDIAPRSTYAEASYRDGAAFARAASSERNVIRIRVIIDGLGSVNPLFELAPGEVIFGAPVHTAELSARFFLLAGSHWSEIPVQRLASGEYGAKWDKHDWRETIDARATPDEPHPVFRAWELEPHIGRRRLIEVLMTEGTARALFWIVVDRGASGALRVATSVAEYRGCLEWIRPPSAAWLGWPDTGFPAPIDVVPPHREMGDESVLDAKPPICPKRGTIDWKPSRGFVVEIHDIPCTDPWLALQAVNLDGEGNLTLRPLQVAPLDARQ